MPNYLTEDGLDYAAMLKDAEDAQHFSHDGLREKRLSSIRAVALVDIALSLSSIVTGLATGGLWLDGAEAVTEDDEPDDEPEAGPEGEPLDPEPTRSIEVDDWVEAISPDDDPRGPWRVTAMGESEGSVWISDYTGVRYWAEDYVHAAMEGDESDDEPVLTPGSEPLDPEAPKVKKPKKSKGD